MAMWFGRIEKSMGYIKFSEILHGVFFCGLHGGDVHLAAYLRQPRALAGFERISWFAWADTDAVLSAPASRIA